MFVIQIINYYKIGTTKTLKMFDTPDLKVETVHVYDSPIAWV